MDQTLVLYSLVLLLSLTLLYDQITKRIPTRLRASQAPKSGFGLIPAAGNHAPVRAKGVE